MTPAAVLKLDGIHLHTKPDFKCHCAKNVLFLGTVAPLQPYTVEMCQWVKVHFQETDSDTIDPRREVCLCDKSVKLFQKLDFSLGALVEQWN